MVCGGSGKLRPLEDISQGLEYEGIIFGDIQVECYGALAAPPRLQLQLQLHFPQQWVVPVWVVDLLDAIDTSSKYPVQAMIECVDTWRGVEMCTVIRPRKKLTRRGSGRGVRAVRLRVRTWQKFSHEGTRPRSTLVRTINSHILGTWRSPFPLQPVLCDEYQKQ